MKVLCPLLPMLLCIKFFHNSFQDLGLLFNIYPHTVHSKTRHGDRIIKLFKEIFDTIALVGDIPEDAGDELVQIIDSLRSPVLFV